MPPTSLTFSSSPWTRSLLGFDDLMDSKCCLCQGGRWDSEAWPTYLLWAIILMRELRKRL